MIVEQSSIDYCSGGSSLRYCWSGRSQLIVEPEAAGNSLNLTAVTRTASGLDLLELWNALGLLERAKRSGTAAGLEPSGTARSALELPHAWNYLERAKRYWNFWNAPWSGQYRKSTTTEAKSERMGKISNFAKRFLNRCRMKAGGRVWAKRYRRLGRKADCRSA